MDHVRHPRTCLFEKIDVRSISRVVAVHRWLRSGGLGKSTAPVKVTRVPKSRITKYTNANNKRKVVNWLSDSQYQYLHLAIPQTQYPRMQ